MKYVYLCCAGMLLAGFAVGLAAGSYIEKASQQSPGYIYMIPKPVDLTATYVPFSLADSDFKVCTEEK